MSITKDTLQKHLTDPAVFCCRRAKGTVIGADDLEDPTLFDDMVDAGLLTLSDDGLTIEEVLGSTLLQDVEALTPITKDVLDKVNAKSVPAEAPAEPVKASPAAPAAPTAAPSGTIHLKIDKLEGLSLDIPAGTILGAAGPLPAGPTEKTGERRSSASSSRNTSKSPMSKSATRRPLKTGRSSSTGPSSKRPSKRTRSASA